MSGTLLIGKGREVHRVPDDAFLQAIEGIPAQMASRLAFMTRDHHTVRNFVVREMPRRRKALSPEDIASATTLAVANVATILSDLEKSLFFLVRDSDGNVNWAFPVTTTVTPHRLTFSTGERIFGA
jgi:hypothetical protein